MTVTRLSIVALISLAFVGCADPVSHEKGAGPSANPRPVASGSPAHEDQQTDDHLTRKTSDAMAERFELVVQIDFADYDYLTNIEKYYTADFFPGTMTTVTGLVVGDEEMQIHLLTDNPREAFQSMHEDFEARELLDEVQVGYRVESSQDFTWLWPRDAKGELTFKLPKMCCEGIRRAFDDRSKPSVYVFAERPQVKGKPTFWLATHSDASTTRCAIEFCPWCGVKLGHYYLSTFALLCDEQISARHK